LDSVRRYPVNPDRTDSYNKAFDILKKRVEDAKNKAEADNFWNAIESATKDFPSNLIEGMDVLKIKEQLDQSIDSSIGRYEQDLKYIRTSSRLDEIIKILNQENEKQCP
jgi:hypothetical protein